MAVTQYIGARYVPVFANPAEWTNTKQYEPLTIVLHEGNSYTSRQFVPIGVDIDNTDFWAKTGNYNAQIEQYRNDIETFENEMNGRFESFTTNIEETVDELSDMIDITKFPANAVQLVAHRGSMDEAPENSLLAFNLAFLEGADFVETDVQKSSDGHFFLMHDDTIDRMTNASGNCAELPWSYLQNLTLIDSTAWAPHNDPQKIPSLDSFLKLMSATNMRFLLEIKQSVTLSDLNELVQNVLDYGLQGNVIFISFFWDRIYHIKDEHPSLQCFPIDGNPTRASIDQHVSHHVDGVAVPGDTDAGTLNYIMEKNLLLNMYTGTDDLTTRQILPNFWTTNNIAQVRTMRLKIGAQTNYQYYTNRILYKYGLFISQYVNYLYSIRHDKVSVPYMPEGSDILLRCQTNMFKNDIRFSDILTIDGIVTDEASSSFNIIRVNDADAFDISYSQQMRSNSTYFGMRFAINRDSYPLVSLRAALELISMNWELDVITTPQSFPAVTNAPTGANLVSNPQGVPNFMVQNGVYVVPKSTPLYPWFQTFNKRVACIYALNSNLQRVDGNVIVDGDVFPAGGALVFDVNTQDPGLWVSGHNMTDKWKNDTKFWPYFDYLLIITDMCPVQYTHNNIRNYLIPDSKVRHVPLMRSSAISPYVMQ